LDAPNRQPQIGKSLRECTGPIRIWLAQVVDRALLESNPRKSITTPPQIQNRNVAPLKFDSDQSKNHFKLN
jgi:hypothetical protein